MPQDSVDLSQSPESCVMLDNINWQQYFVLQLFPDMRHDGECNARLHAVLACTEGYPLVKRSLDKQ